MVLVFSIQPWFNGTSLFRYNAREYSLREILLGMGVYNAFVLLGCIATAFSLTAIIIWVWGKKFRAKSTERYRYYAEKQFVLRSL
jgi:hypothetical protein